MATKYLFLDCFGVLYDEVAPFALKEAYGEANMKKIRRDLFPRIDLGEITLEEGFGEMVASYGGAMEDLRERWASHTHLKEGIPALLSRLAKSYRLVLVSNAPLGTVESLFAENGLRGLFAGLFVSSAMRLAKPSPRYFDAVETLLGISSPREIAFFDDTEANVLAGKKRGYRAFRVEEGGLKKAVEAFLAEEEKSDVAV